MAELDFTFVEDPGFDVADSVNAWLHWGKRTKSVKDMVDTVSAALKPGDCIKSLRLYGHGEPGDFSVGNGQEGTDPAKEITNRNESVWGPQLDRLACRFCKMGDIILNGCEVGAGKEGAALLFKIMKRLKCAYVFAPVIEVRPLTLILKEEWQLVSPRAEKAPAPRSGPVDQRWKKKKQLHTALVSGPTLQDLRVIDPRSIIGARYVPRVLGEPFHRDQLAGSAAIQLPRDLTGELADCFPGVIASFRPGVQWVANGYLQFKAKSLDGRGPAVWSFPGTIMAGGHYYSALQNDTTIIYEFPPAVARRLGAFCRQTHALRQAKPRAGGF